MVDFIGLTTINSGFFKYILVDSGYGLGIWSFWERERERERERGIYEYWVKWKGWEGLVDIYIYIYTHTYTHTDRHDFASISGFHLRLLHCTGFGVSLDLHSLSLAPSISSFFSVVTSMPVVFYYSNWLRKPYF